MCSRSLHSDRVGVSRADLPAHVRLPVRLVLAPAAAQDGVVATKVVIADDAVLLREGTARLLSEHGFDVVGQAGDAEDLLLKVRSYSPDVAIVDIRMPPSYTDEGLRAAKEIHARHPETAVLVLSQYVETE